MSFILPCLRDETKTSHWVVIVFLIGPNFVLRSCGQCDRLGGPAKLAIWHWTIAAAKPELSGELGAPRRLDRQRVICCIGAQVDGPIISLDPGRANRRKVCAGKTVL